MGVKKQQFALKAVLSAVLLLPQSSIAWVEGSLFEPNSVGSEPLSLQLPTLNARPSQMLQYKERLVGEAILRQVRQQAPLLNDAWSEDQLRRVFNRLNSQANLPAPVAFLLINDPQINAFAVPGGLVAINAGLVLAARDLDEVAGVLGHEVAHVSQRHFSRRNQDLRYSQWLSLGGIVAGLLIGKQDSDIGTAVATGAQAAAINQQLAYSRDQEREADRVGMQLMRAAGFAPRAMPNFFELMQRQQGNMGFLPDFMLTHPLTAERISESRLRAEQYPPADKNTLAQQNQQQNFKLLQGRIAALSGKIEQQSLLPLVARGELAAQVTLATVYRMQQRWDDARRLIAPLQKALPDHVLVQMVAAEIERDAGQLVRADSILAPLQAAMPENRALTLLLAQIQLAQHKTDAAMALLKPLAEREPSAVEVWQLLQQAASQTLSQSASQSTSQVPAQYAEQTVQVLRYRAEAEFWQGEVDRAIVSLDRAMVLAKSDPLLLATTQQRLDEMKAQKKTKIE